MALKNWEKGERHSYGIAWTKHTDFSQPKYRNMKNPTAFVYFYNKGSFRNKEDKWVISTSRTGGSSPSDRRDIGFKTKTQALAYARSYMRKH